MAIQICRVVTHPTRNQPEIKDTKAQTSTTANIYAHAIASARAKAMQTFDRFNDLVGQDLAAKQPSVGITKAVGS